MGRKYPGKISWGSGFNITSASPIDSRMVVDTETALFQAATWDANEAPLYVGMTVTVADSGKIFIFTPKSVTGESGQPAPADATKKENWTEIGKGTATEVGALQTEVNSIETAAGFTSNGEYIKAAADHTIINSAISTYEATEKLDEAIRYEIIARQKADESYFAKATKYTDDEIGKLDLAAVESIGYPITYVSQVNGKVYAKTSHINAAAVNYDNGNIENHIGAQTVQEAIDMIGTAYVNAYLPEKYKAGQAITHIKQVNGVVTAEAGDIAAQHVTFDNTASGLTATNVKAAIDEVEVRIQHLEDFKDGDDIKITGYQGQFLTGFEKKDGKVISTYFAYSHMKDIQVDGNGWTQIPTKSETLKDALDSVDAKLETINGEGAGSIKKAYSDIVGGADEYHNTLGKLQNKVIAAKTVINDKSDEHVHITGEAQVDGHMLYTLEENDIASANALASEVAKRATDDAAIANSVGLNGTYQYTPKSTNVIYTDKSIAYNVDALDKYVGNLNTSLSNNYVTHVSAAGSYAPVAKFNKAVESVGLDKTTYTWTSNSDAIKATAATNMSDALDFVGDAAYTAKANAKTANDNLGKVRTEIGLTASYEYVVNGGYLIEDDNNATIVGNINILDEKLYNTVVNVNAYQAAESSAIEEMRKSSGFDTSYKYSPTMNDILDGDKPTSSRTSLYNDIDKLGDILGERIYGKDNLSFNEYNLPNMTKWENITPHKEAAGGAPEDNSFMDVFEGIDSALGEIKNTTYAADIKGLQDHQAVLDEHQGNLANSINGDAGSYIYTSHASNNIAKQNIVKSDIHELDAVLNTVKTKVDGLQIEKITDTEQLGVNDLAKYRLVAARGGEEIGDEIVIPKDQALVHTQLGHVGAKLPEKFDESDPKIVDGPTTANDALIFVYRLADGTYKLVAVDLGSFLNENEFKDGLKVTGSEVSVDVAATADKNVNFLELEGQKAGEKQLAVRKMNADVTYTTESFKVGLPGGVKLGQYTNGVEIPANTSVLEILMKILQQEVWPTNVKSNKGSFSASVAAPAAVKLTVGNSSVNSGSVVHAGLAVSTASAIVAQPASISKVSSTVTGLEYGYSESVSGPVNPAKSITKPCVVESKESYQMGVKTEGFNAPKEVTQAIDNATASNVKFNAQAIGNTAVGTMTIKAVETTPEFYGTISAIPVIYYAANTGKLNAEKKTSGTAMVSGTVKPTNTLIMTLTGVYPVYTSQKGTALHATADVLVDATSGTTLYFNNIGSEVSSGNRFKVEFPASHGAGSAVKLNMKDLQGKYKPVKYGDGYTIVSAGTKTINGEEVPYNRLVTAGAPGGDGICFEIILTKELQTA